MLRQMMPGRQVQLLPRRLSRQLGVPGNLVTCRLGSNSVRKLQTKWRTRVMDSHRPPLVRAQRSPVSLRSARACSVVSVSLSALACARAFQRVWSRVVLTAQSCNVWCRVLISVLILFLYTHTTCTVVTVPRRYSLKPSRTVSKYSQLRTRSY